LAKVCWSQYGTWPKAGNLLKTLQKREAVRVNNEKTRGKILELGDLVWLRLMMETGIVVEPSYTSEVSGREYVGVLLSDTDNVVIKARTEWCELISRPFGSTSLPTPFPKKLYQGKGPNLQKFSSEKFRELSTLTIDEEI
tara:strand:- start:213 stop:632 length:420 start_codon:yes stop_codon:yes gene_type:complete